MYSLILVEETTIETQNSIFFMKIVFLCISFYLNSGTKSKREIEKSSCGCKLEHEMF